MKKEFVKPVIEVCHIAGINVIATSGGETVPTTSLGKGDGLAETGTKTINDEGYTGVIPD